MGTGNPRNLYQKFRFFIEIDGIGSAKFKDGSELACEIGETVYWQGGSLTPIKLNGRMTFPDVTLSRGASSDFDLYNWLKASADAAANESSQDFRNADWVQMKGDNKTRGEEFEMYEARVRRWSSGDWDADSDDVRMESVALGYAYFNRAAA